MRHKHSHLIEISPGYRDFVAQQQEIDDDLSLVMAFASDWLLAVPPNEEAIAGYAGWTADQFRREWDWWNS